MLVPRLAYVGKVLSDGVYNLIQRYVSDGRSDQLKDRGTADREHPKVRLWWRIELEGPAVCTSASPY